MWHKQGEQQQNSLLLCLSRDTNCYLRKSISEFSRWGLRCSELSLSSDTRKYSNYSTQPQICHHHDVSPTVYQVENMKSVHIYQYVKYNEVPLVIKNEAQPSKCPFYTHIKVRSLRPDRYRKPRTC